MNELHENNKTKLNYYALFLSIVKGKTAKEALIAMGCCPSTIETEEEN